MKQFIALLALVLLFGCAAPEQAQKGTLQGHISIGPICPVERFPNDPLCVPTEQTYLNYPFDVYKIVGMTNSIPGGPIYEKVEQFHGDKDGNYRIELPAGSYTVKQETGLSKFSKEIEISANRTTELNIDIDTGIR